MIPVLNGIYRAKVETTIDPLGNGRFAVRITQPPSVDTAKLMWVTYTSPFGGTKAGTGAGLFFPPAKGSVVLIAFENGDWQAPVYIATIYSPNRYSDNNVVPFEAADAFQEPLNRIIKTDKGHALELDDRDRTSDGSPTSGVRLKTGAGKFLELGDGSQRVELNSGALGHRLSMFPSQLILTSRIGQGLFVQDDESIGAGLWLKSFHPDDEGMIMTKGNISLGAQNQVKIKSDNFNVENLSKTKITTSGFEVFATSSTTFTSGGSNVFSSLGKTNFTSVGGFDFLLTGGNPTVPSNFIVRSPIPGIPELSGMALFDFMPPASLTMRVGAYLPNPTLPGFLPSTPDLGDATSTARISVGGVLGAAVLEGLLGGIYVSPVPVPLPGTTIPPPFKQPGPYLPGVIKVHEPLVKGISLVTYFGAMVAWLNTLIGALAASTANWGISAAGPVAAGPAVVAALAAAVSTLNSTILPPLTTPDHPQGFLSSIVFTQ